MINSSSIKNILIFGGSGFLGTNLLINLLKNKNLHISVYDLNLPIILRSKDSSFTEIHTDDLRFIKGNFVKETNFDQILDGIDCVVHLIHTKIPEDSVKDKDNEIKTNLIPSIKLFEAAVKKKLQKIIFISTGGKIYGNRKIMRPIKESEEPNVIFPYEISKLAIEKHLKLITTDTGTDFFILRPSNPYGENYFYNDRPLGFINVALNNLKDSKNQIVWGDGNNIRDFIYIQDLINAIDKSIFHTGSCNKILNIGTCTGINILGVIDMIEKITGKKIKLKFENSRKIDVNYNVLDISTITDLFNWLPNVSLEEGIKRTWEWLNALDY